MKRFLILAFIIFISVPVWGESAFLDGLDDVPLMEGLIVNSNPNIDFDTPAGQITVIQATGVSLTGEKIKNYYKQTLPALGWKFENHRYIREKDSLIITILKESHPAVVRFETTVTNGL